jgi:hypothetical protein
MMARIGLITLLFGTIPLVGCVAGSQEEPVGSQGEELSTTSRTYVALRRDLRKCAAPACGGYLVHDVNRVFFSEKYVSDLDFSASGLDAATIDLVKNAPANEIVLYGKLGPKEPVHHTRMFVVSDAYRGMPGKSPIEGDTFYKTEHRVPAIECFVAPCDNEIAKKLNSTTKYAFTGLSVDDALPPWGDTTWLGGRALDHGAIVAGSFVDGALEPGGYESILAASQVFIHLPESVGPCPAFPQPDCGNEKATFTRNADRCVIFDECVKPGICPQFIPACPDGYTLSSFASAPAGCPHFACDPTFITQ